MKKVYLLLLRMKPNQAGKRIVKSIIKGKYSHICLSKDGNMNDMIGFTNKIMHENIEKFSRNRACKILELDIEEVQSQKLDEIVKYYFTTKKKYTYNLLGTAICAFILVPMFNRGIRWHLKLANKLMRRKDKFTCSNFVMNILYKSDICFLDGITDDNFTPYHIKWSVAPYQFDMIGLKVCFEGTVGELINQTGGCKFAASNQDFWIKHPVLHAV